MDHVSVTSQMPSISQRVSALIRTGFPFSRFVYALPFFPLSLIPPIRSLPGHNSGVNVLTFSKDGRCLVSGGDGASIVFSYPDRPSLTFRSLSTDLQLRLWDFHQDDLTTSFSSCIGPRVRYYLCLERPILAHGLPSEQRIYDSHLRFNPLYILVSIFMFEFDLFTVNGQRRN